MSEQIKGDFIMVTGTASFVRARELQYGDDDTEKKYGKYSLNVILDTDSEYPLLKAAVKEAAEEVFGENAMNMLKKGKVKSPLKRNSTFENDAGERYKGYENDDGFTVAAIFYDPMMFVDQFGNKMASDSKEAEKAIYSGCKVKVALAAPYFKEHQSGNKFGRIMLAGLMKKGEGERLGGGFTAPDADDLFGDEKFEEPEFTEPTSSDAGAADDGEAW